MYVPDGNDDNGPISRAQTVSEVNTAPPDSQPHPPLDSNSPQDLHKTSRNEDKRTRESGQHKHGQRSHHHHSNHRHRSPDKRVKTRHQNRKSSSSGNNHKRGDKRYSKDDSHNHQHQRRHHSPEKRRRARSAENTLDSRHERRHGRSPERRHQRHSSPRRHRSPHHPGHRHRSPQRHRSPHRSRYQSPHQQSNPTSDRPRNGKPQRDEDVALKEPPSPVPSFNVDSVLDDMPAMDRLNRESPLPRMSYDGLERGNGLMFPGKSYSRLNSSNTLPRQIGNNGNSLPQFNNHWNRDDILPRTSYDQFSHDDALPRLSYDRVNRNEALRRESYDSLPQSNPFPRGSLDRFLTMEPTYNGDSLPRRTYQDQSLPRIRTPDSDTAFQKYNSLLRGRSPERKSRLSQLDSPEAASYRARSLEPLLPASGSRNMVDSEEEDKESSVRNYYSKLKSNYGKVNNQLPEPRRKAYKENSKDLSI